MTVGRGGGMTVGRGGGMMAVRGGGDMRALQGYYTNSMTHTGIPHN